MTFTVAGSVRVACRRRHAGAHLVSIIHLAHMPVPGAGRAADVAAAVVISIPLVLIARPPPPPPAPPPTPLAPARTEARDHSRPPVAVAEEAAAVGRVARRASTSFELQLTPFAPLTRKRKSEMGRREKKVQPRCAARNARAPLPRLAMIQTFPSCSCAGSSKCGSGAFRKTG
jgi:hypothetical protein